MNNNHHKPAECHTARGRMLILAAGILTAALGLLVLAGWVLHLPLLASFGPKFIPMAPSTALLFVLYGTAVSLRARMPLGRRAHYISAALLSLAMMVALLLFALSALGIYLEAEYLGLIPRESVVGHMSQVAAFCFVLAGISILASLPPFPAKRWRVTAALLSAGLLVGCSFVLMLAYSFYGPDLAIPGGHSIPALNALIAFAVLGLAVLALACRMRQPVKALEPGRGNFPAFILLFLLLAGGVVAVGQHNFRSFEKNHLAELEKQLSIVEQLKVDDLVRFRKGLLNDGGILARNEDISIMVRRCLAPPPGAGAPRHLLTWFERFHQYGEYDVIRLLDAQGVTRLSSPANLPPVSSALVRRIPEILRAGQVVIQDLYRNDYDHRVYMDVLVPVFDEATNTRPPLGVFYLRVDPEKYLYPSLNRWPTHSGTAKTLLLRREGNEAVFLNNLLFQTNAALNLRVSLDNKDMPAVKAVLGQTGTVNGVDYCGCPTIASVRPIPDSPWFLVSRMDAEEAYAPMRERLWQLVGLMSALLLSGAVGVGLIWRQRRLGFYRKELRSAEVLRQSEDRWRFAIEGSGDGLWDRNVPAGTVFFTRRYKEMLGYADHEIGDRLDEWSQRVHPDDLARVMADVQAHLDGMTSQYTSEYRIRCKDGSWKWIFARGMVVSRDAAGRALRLIGTHTDISERKRAEDALDASEKLLRDAQVIAGMGSYLLEIATGQWSSSEGLDRVFGIGPAYERSVKGWTALIHPDDRAMMQSYFTNEVLVEHKNFDKNYRIVRHSDKSVRWVHGLGNVELDAQRRPVKMHGTIHDITGRKEAEETQARLTMAVEQAAEMIVITSTAGAILYVNPAFEKITGYTRGEALGQNPRILKSGKHDAEFYRQMWAVLGAGRAWTGHIINKRKDGTLLEEDASISPVLDAAGKIVNYVAVKRDVTEQHKLEAQMLRTQRLESIGTLAGGVAHDLNNALAPILMASELLRLEFPGTASRYLETIHDGARRGADMVKQLLTFAKGAEGDRLLLQPKHLLKEMEKLIRSTFPKKLELRFRYADDLRTILGDATQLHQVLLNLCVNARDAMPEGGTLTMEANNEVLDPVQASAMPDARPGSFVVWRVTDTGTGIPPAVLEHIFDPFFTTKGPDKGTGLGLSTALGIVKGHDGFIQVHSIPGQGSTFAVYLPAYGFDAGDAALLTKSETSFRGHGETILVVDDEEFLLKILRAVLTKLNFKVLTATNGTTALLKVTEKQADLRAVITDLHMPGMDGLSFVRLLKLKLPEVGIIVASGRMEEPQADEFRKLGVSAMLDKPFTKEKLVEALKIIFQK